MDKNYRGSSESPRGIMGNALIPGNKSGTDPFTELIQQIDSLLDQIPTLIIPSNVISGEKVEIIKQVIKKTLDNMNVGRFGMIACSVVNLIARHSGNKRLSNISGFIQNCMAIYSIGDSINEKLKLRWNYNDALYMSCTHAIPDSSIFDISFVESVNEFCQNSNASTGVSIPLSSAYALVKMCTESKKVEWVNNGETHTIEPLFTNVLSAERKAVYDKTGNQDGTLATLKYKMNPKYSYDSGLGRGDDGLGARNIAVFVFKFDKATVYLRIPILNNSNQNSNSNLEECDANVNLNESDAFEDFSPSYSNVQFMWVPDVSIPHREYNVSDTTMNITTFIGMMFAMFLDTKNFVFTINDEYELYEMPRPKNIPTKYVSNSVEKIVNAITVMHDKNLSRGFAFVGYPGTGKTVAAQQISNHFDDVCTFKISGDTVDDTDSIDALIRYVKAVRKCIIIVDDMDSSNLSIKNDAVCRYLDFFDKLNMAAKNDGVSFVFLATVNDPSKINSTIMKRSGRIDEMIEIGYPSEDVIKYLFNYNDEIVNPNHRTDFNDEKFNDAIKFAAAHHVTAADINNIFSDIVIYNADDDITPDMIIDAVNRIANRNTMSTYNYLDGGNEIPPDGVQMLTPFQRSMMNKL